MVAPLEVEVDQVALGVVAGPLDHHDLARGGQRNDVGVLVDDLRRRGAERLRLDGYAALSAEAAQHPWVSELGCGISRPEHDRRLGARSAGKAAQMLELFSSNRSPGRARGDQEA